MATDELDDKTLLLAVTLAAGTGYSWSIGEVLGELHDMDIDGEFLHRCDHEDNTRPHLCRCEIDQDHTADEYDGHFTLGDE
jgi:hypothetical protein